MRALFLPPEVAAAANDGAKLEALLSEYEAAAAAHAALSSQTPADARVATIRALIASVDLVRMVPTIPPYMRAALDSRRSAAAAELDAAVAAASPPPPPLLLPHHAPTSGIDGVVTPPLSAGVSRFRPRASTTLSRGTGGAIAAIMQRRSSLVSRPTSPPLPHPLTESAVSSMVPDPHSSAPGTPRGGGPRSPTTAAEGGGPGTPSVRSGGVGGASVPGSAAASARSLPGLRAGDEPPAVEPPPPASPSIPPPPTPPQEESADQLHDGEGEVAADAPVDAGVLGALAPLRAAAMFASALGHAPAASALLDACDAALSAAPPPTPSSGQDAPHPAHPEGVLEPSAALALAAAEVAAAAKSGADVGSIPASTALAAAAFAAACAAAIPPPPIVAAQEGGEEVAAARARESALSHLTALVAAESALLARPGGRQSAEHIQLKRQQRDAVAAAIVALPKGEAALAEQMAAQQAALDAVIAAASSAAGASAGGSSSPRPGGAAAAAAPAGAAAGGYRRTGSALPTLDLGRGRLPFLRRRSSAQQPPGAAAGVGKGAAV